MDTKNDSSYQKKKKINKQKIGDQNATMSIITGNVFSLSIPIKRHKFKK